uniref:G_PROTEIN_RECEP_F1_2 domain-containing protein n=1 Tax=Panagrellus redivivus TaxID=6233 RepID=A0A7E4VLQ2_PANRE
MAAHNLTEEDLTRRIKQKIWDRCTDLFGYEMDWLDCSQLIKKIINLKQENISQCYASQNSKIVLHNPDYYSSCGSVEHLISQYAIPILQLLCLFGNVINLLIYRLPYFDGSSSVHFLRAKALANLIFVQSRVFEVIHAWTYEAQPVFERTYWDTKPYFITIANISGTISTWMTFLVTIETVLCVLLPFSFRQYCTHRMTYILLVSSGIASLVLHFTFLATHTVVGTTMIASVAGNDNDCWEARTWFSVQTKPLFVHAVYEKVYYWTQMTVSITLPTIAMLVCSVLILTRFTFKQELGEAFSQRRKCVIRMTVATTVSHLLFEGPALLTFGAAALKGAGSESHNTTTCILNHANNLLSMVNATIPFFVFLACNQQFRHMTLVYLRAQFECSREKKKALLAQASSRIRTTRDTERSFIDQTLIAKVSTI